MSFITDPTGSIYEPKVNWRERPSVRTVQQWIDAEDMNAIRSGLVEIAQFCQLTGGLIVTGSADMLLPSGTIDIGNAAEMGVVVSGLGVSEYVGFVATNGSGSAIDLTIQPNNSITMLTLGHGATDGGSDASNIQVIANNDFTNGGGPTVSGQHATEHLRIYDVNNVLRLGFQNTDRVDVTGAVRLTTVLNLQDNPNSSPTDGDVWMSGSDILVRITGSTYKMSLAAYP